MLFLYSDQRKLSHWQLTILSYWQEDKLKLHFLEQSLMHLPIFPERTIQSMIALLPQARASDTLDIETRKLLFNIQKKINRSHQLRNIVIILSLNDCKNSDFFKYFIY